MSATISVTMLRKSLMHFVSHHVDYGNSAVVRLPKQSLHHLLGDLNQATRLVFMVNQSSHVFPSLDQLRLLI